MAEGLPVGDAAAIRAAVAGRYRAAAAGTGERFPYAVGRPAALAHGYGEDLLGALPAAAAERFVGVSNPFRIRRPAPGERVLDVGCGGGLDVFAAALLAGPGGRAVGLDLVPEMAAAAGRAAEGWTGGHASFAAGAVESLPFPDGAFDLVLSNGVLNLVPDKDAAFREIHRVLRPGGRLAAADLLVTESVPPEVLASLDAWST